jgi:hypothetical protein
MASGSPAVVVEDNHVGAQEPCQPRFGGLASFWDEKRCIAAHSPGALSACYIHDKQLGLPENTTTIV